MAAEERVRTKHPVRGKTAPRIEKSIYDAFRKAILSVVPVRGGVAFKELPDKVRAKLPKKVLARIRSVTWYTTVVKLDLEARGEIERLPGTGPQRLHKLKR